MRKRRGEGKKDQRKKEGGGGRTEKEAAPSSGRISAALTFLMS